MSYTVYHFLPDGSGEVAQLALHAGLCGRAIAVYVILDLEFSRVGLIRADAFDRALVALRESMK